MIQTQKEKQERRSALKAVISSSKRTTMDSSSSPPLGHPSHRTGSLSSSNSPDGGRGTASPGLTKGEHWWQDDGKLEGSFVACLASPLAGHWLNQGPGARPSAGAAVSSDPLWVWTRPRRKKVRKCLSLVYWIHCHSPGPSQDNFSLITHRHHKPAQNINFLVLLSFWISIIRSLFDAERNCVKVTGITKRYSSVKASHLAFFACRTEHVQDLPKKMSSISPMESGNLGLFHQSRVPSEEVRV